MVEVEHERARPRPLADTPPRSDATADGDAGKFTFADNGVQPTRTGSDPLIHLCWIIILKRMGHLQLLSNDGLLLGL